MSTYEYSSFMEGVKIYVDVISVDPHTSQMVLCYRETFTERAGRESITSETDRRIWRRAERGTAGEPWELQATDGSWHSVSRNEVDTEVRMTWLKHNVPIRRNTKVVKIKKHYVDVTAKSWRDKFNEARALVH